MTVATTAVRGLYAITPDLSDTALLVRMVEAALDGGAQVVQYRNKSADAGLRAEQAEALAASCARYDATLIVNDHADLALAIDGAGLHVGADDAGDLPALRARLGPDRVLGVSCYDTLDRAHAAVAGGADYVAFGSVFASTTKPAAVSAALDLFARARDLDVPLVGIGGITRANIGRLVAAGADAAAVIGDLFASRDPALIRTHARQLAAAFPPGPTP